MIADRREFVNAVFKEIIDVLNKHNVRTWIDQGTLLGCYRDGKFIDHDLDIDFAMLMNDIPQLFSALLDFQKLGYITRVHCSDITIIKNEFPVTFAVYQLMPDEFYFHIDYPSTTLSQLNINYWRCRWRYTLEILHDAIAYNGYQTRRCDYENQAYELTRRSDTMQKIAKFILTNAWRVLGGRYFGYHTPRKYFDSLSSLNVLRKTVLIPSNAEEYLAFKYGSDWRTPKRNWHIWTDDGAIITHEQIKQKYRSWHTLVEYKNWM